MSAAQAYALASIRPHVPAARRKLIDAALMAHSFDRKRAQLRKLRYWFEADYAKRRALCLSLASS